MRRVILLAAFLAACGEGPREEGLDGPVVSLTPNITGTWRAELSGEGFLTGDTSFTAPASALAEFRFTQSGNLVGGEYAVEGTISTLDPNGDAFTFPFTAAGPADGDVTLASGNIAMWRVLAHLRSFSAGADASFTAYVTTTLPTEFSISGIRFQVAGLVHEGRTYEFNVTGRAVRLRYTPRASRGARGFLVPCSN